MSLYAVKNDEGEWLGVDRNGSDHWQASHGDIYSGWFSANERASVFGGHVVELVESPAKIVVSEEEAEMLEQAKDDYCAASVISAYSTEHIGAMGQDRLMRAYVNGWTVEKPKLWNIKVPHTKNGWYFKYVFSDDDNEEVREDRELCAQCEDAPTSSEEDAFTLAEIEHYGLQDCERVEIKQEDEK